MKAAAKGSLVSQRSGNQHALPKAVSFSAPRSRQLSAAHSASFAHVLSRTSSIKQAPSVELQDQHVTVSLDAPRNTITRSETSDLMEKFHRAMTTVKGKTRKKSLDMSSSWKAPLSDAVAERTDSAEPKKSPSTPPVKKTTSPKAGLAKTGSRNISGVLSSASRRASGTASLWMRKTTSCLTGRLASLELHGDDENVRLERRPSEDILVMVQEQRKHYEDLTKQTRAEIRLKQRQNEFLRSQLEAIKKTNPKQKTLMRAVDELDAMMSVARKLELKLQCLKEEHDVLHRKVFSNQAAQQALESLEGNRLTIHDETWHHDLNVFSKLAYAGLLKGYSEEP